MPHGCEICLPECYYVALHFHTLLKRGTNTTESGAEEGEQRKSVTRGRDKETGSWRWGRSLSPQGELQVIMRTDNRVIYLSLRKSELLVIPE